MPELIQPSNHVLLVEDSADDEALTVRSLKTLGFQIQIEVRRDGLQAAEFIAAMKEEKARLFILDLKLPKINGIELVEIIRRNPFTKFAPVVMLTSSDEPRDLLQSYQAGASGFVRKPVDYDQYVAAVKCLGTFWVGYNLMAPKIRSGESQ